MYNIYFANVISDIIYEQLKSNRLPFVAGHILEVLLAEEEVASILDPF